MSSRSTVILGTGAYAPERVLTNDDMAHMVETSDEWIRSRTGIRERRLARPDETCSDMGVQAAHRALVDAKLTATDIDLLIVATVTPDLPMPAAACFIQTKLGVPSTAACFDLNAACSGFVYALDTACAMLASGRYRHALIIGVEKLSSVVDWQDRTTCVLFGDGAGAAVIEASDDDSIGILDFENYMDGSGGDALCMPAGGSLRPATHETIDQRLHYVKQEGQTVFRFAVRNMEEVCRRILERNGIKPCELNLFAAHQANRRIILSTAEKLGMPLEKVIINIDRFGNTTGGTIPLVLNDAIEQNRLQRGDLVLCASVGAVLMRWGLKN